MPIDTRDKRASALGLTLGLALTLPLADGLTFSQGDRQHVAFCYRGVLAGSPVVITPARLDLEGGFGFTVAVTGADGFSLSTTGASGFRLDVEGGN